MKRRYADGGDVFREGMGVPANTADMMTAPGPMTKAQRLGKMVIGKPSDLTAAERKKFSRMPMEPVSGEEVSVEKEKVSRKKLAAGGYTKAADGCAKRGKTRGKMV